MKRSSNTRLLILAILILGLTGCASTIGGANAGCTTGTLIGGPIGWATGGLGSAVGCAAGLVVGGAAGTAVGIKNAVTSQYVSEQTVDWRYLPHITREEIAQHLKAEHSADPAYTPSQADIDYVLLWRETVAHVQ